jgi:Ca2+/Na+ antiporter
MVKVGTLIFSIISAVGAVLVSIIFMMVAQSASTYELDLRNTNSDVTFLDLAYWAGILTPNGAEFSLVPLSIMIFYIGMALVFLSSISTKKVMMIIGGLLSGVGMIATMFAWLSNEVYDTGYIIGSIILLVGILIYLVGLIKYRRNFKLGLMTGPLMLIITIAVNMIFGLFFEYKASKSHEEFINTHLILQVIQAWIFVLHGILFSFSKKNADEEEGAEEELSIETGSAFQSYVPDEMKKPKKKEKAPKSEEIEWKF